MIKDYRVDLDILKGISIIAVVLYHIGLLPYGYLGVDTFLVINGFFIIPSLFYNIVNDNYDYGKWIFKRISRFLPIVLLAFCICLSVGYFTMIPDDFENLAQSVFASGIFCNNILAAITTKNYWDTANEFKPLMHFWYLGIVVQFYFVLPLILLSVKKLTRRNQNVKKTLFASIIVISSISFILYLLPIFSDGDKFYYLPFRIWEFGVGGLIGLTIVERKLEIKSSISILVLLLLVVVFCFSPKNLSDLNYTTVVGASVESIQMIPKEVFLIIVVLFSSILLVKRENDKMEQNFVAKILSVIGKMSLSIFVWHQIMLAFLRYAFIDKMSVSALMMFFVILTLFSYFSFRYIELIKIDALRKKFLIFFLLIILVISFSIYRNAGVVRDVPELDITLANPYANRNTEYTDKIYNYDKPFSLDAKIKVLVVGNSFARDLACVLLEWDKDNILDISYKTSFSGDIDKRYFNCDYLFSFGPKEKVPSIVWNSINENCQVYGIGTKSYGKSFGRIYAKRHDINYFKSKIPINPLCEKTNNEWKNSWGEDNYIDFMNVIKVEGDSIRLFTDDNKVISFDCRHLTRNGAKFYAEKLDLDRIFNNIIK